MGLQAAPLKYDYRGVWVHESDIPHNSLRCAETIYVISRKLSGVGWVNYFQGVYVWKLTIS